MKLLQPLPLLFSLASAAAISQSWTSYTQELCQTAFGSTSVHNPPTTTRARTFTFTWTRTSTSTPSTTITPATPKTTVTTTITSTSTSTVPVTTSTTTSTFTTTSTATTVTTTTSTSISTVSIISTSTISSTTTVGTVSGFTPVASVPSVQNNGGGSNVQKREAIPGQVSTQSSNASRLLHGTVTSYPSAVTCDAAVEVVSITTKTLTASKTSTITASTPPTSTSTITVTSSASTVVTPAATTYTVTVTSITKTTTTSTSTTVTTSTSTISSTSYAPMATVYGACQANNFIDQVGSNVISNSYTTAQAYYTSTSDITAIDCCNSCQAAPDCGGFEFAEYNRQTDAQDVVCYLLTVTGTCDPSAQQFTFFNDASSAYVNVVGDGPCGQGGFTTTPYS